MAQFPVQEFFQGYVIVNEHNFVFKIASIMITDLLEKSYLHVMFFDFIFISSVDYN